MTEAKVKVGVKANKRGPKNLEEISRLKKEVITKLRGGCSYTKAAEQLHIERNSIKHWRDTDEHFRAACEYAREMSVERVEDAMYEAALKVSENPRYTTAAIFWLKNRCPGRWRDVKEVRSNTDRAFLADNMTIEELIYQINITKIDVTGLFPAHERAQLPTNNRAFLPEEIKKNGRA